MNMFSGCQELERLPVIIHDCIQSMSYRDYRAITELCPDGLLN